MPEPDEKKFKEHRRRINAQKRASVKMRKSGIFHEDMEFSLKGRLKAYKVRLSARNQVYVAGALGALFGLAFFMVSYSFYNIKMLGLRHENLLETKLIIEDIYEGLDNMRHDFSKASQSSSDTEKLRVVNEWLRGGQLDTLAQKIEEGFAYETEDRFSVLATRSGLLDKIDALNSEINGLNFQRQTLSNETGQMQSRLERNERSYRSVLREAEALQEAVRSAQQRAIRAEENNRLAEDALVETAKTLRHLTGLQGETIDGNAVIQVQSLAGRLVNIHKNQNDLIEGYITSVDYITQNMYRIVRHSGLDIDSLTSEGYLTPAVGGVTGGADELSTGRPASSQKLQSSHENLRRRLNGLESAQKLMRCMPLSVPVENHYITSAYGQRLDPFTRQPELHQGIDFGSWYEKPIWATSDGIVTYAGRRGGYGITVIVDHGCGFETLYAHMSRALVKVGDPIRVGDILGEVGSTGVSTGPHLHYEIRFNSKPYDPYKFLEAGRYVYK